MRLLLVVHRVGEDVARAVAGAHPIPFGTLREFARVSLAEGGEEDTTVALKALDFALTNGEGASVLYPGTHFIDVSPRAPGLAFTLTVTISGEALVLTKPPPMPAR